ncbi:unnamed protein product [Brugia timori]|uniref:Transposase n=1 Tax=Brugia timori TaxID=42155 RepID=A0A0R3Q8E8_9BILA|nr:unnamed protein product [Brugia timori]
MRIILQRQLYVTNEETTHSAAVTTVLNATKVFPA